MRYRSLVIIGCVVLIAGCGISASPAMSVSQSASLFVIDLEGTRDSGPIIGCDDRMHALPSDTHSLESALNALLSLHESHPSGFYNALYQSRLSVDHISLKAGVATVALSGTLRLGGICDIPRVKAQLEATVRQFETVKNVVLTLNGKPLKQALDLSGKTSH